MPVCCSSIVAPSVDTHTPPVPIGASMLEIAVHRAIDEAQRSSRVLVMPIDFGIPTRPEPFAPKEIAAHLSVRPDDVIGLCESGEMIGFQTHVGARTTWKVPWLGIAYFFLRRQGALN